MVEWHGWGTSRKALHIGMLPGRKSVCLYKTEGSVLTPLAYFRNKEAARDTLQLLDRFMDVT